MCISWQSGNVFTDRISLALTLALFLSLSIPRLSLSFLHRSASATAGASQCSRKRLLWLPARLGPCIDAGLQLFAPHCCPCPVPTPAPDPALVLLPVSARMRLIYGIELLLGEFLFISMRVLRVMAASAGSASFEKGAAIAPSSPSHASPAPQCKYYMFI